MLYFSLSAGQLIVQHSLRHHNFSLRSFLALPAIKVIGDYNIIHLELA